MHDDREILTQDRLPAARSELVSSHGSLTMSSREIASLVISRHDKVKLSIERLAGRGVISLPPLGEYLDSLSRPAKEYLVSKRDSYIIVAQLSPEFTARLVDRWQELEAKNAATAELEPFELPKTLSAALRLAADQAEKIEVQAAQIEQQRPAVEFVERYVDASGTKGFRDVCKLLRANERDLAKFLIERRILYRLDGRLVPFQQHIDVGRFQIKAGVTTETERAFNQTRFTAKGIQWVAGLWIARNAMQAAA